MSSNFFNEQLLAGGIESTFRTAGSLNLMTDTFDVGAVTMAPDIAVLNRNNVRPTMSPIATRTGRRRQTWTFPMDVMGSGLADGSRPPAADKLLRMCGMARTSITATAGDVGLARAAPTNVRKDVVPAKHGTHNYTGTMPRLVVVTATAAGAVSVASHDLPNGDAAYSTTGVVATTATVFAGPQGSAFTLTYTGSLTVGDVYHFWVLPRGHLYSPISDPDTAESGYLYTYVGNKRHLMVGARGTFSMAATAGEFGTFNFSLSGDYADPTDVTFPVPGAYSFGPFPEPPMVEVADVSLNNQVVACPTTYGFDMAGSVVSRLCANATGANDGSIITGRAPSATFNMDSVPVATMNVWQRMSQSTQVLLHGYVGQTPGNNMMFLANGQIVGTQYANLDNLRKNDNNMRLCGINGNDELLIFIS